MNAPVQDRELVGKLVHLFSEDGVGTQQGMIVKIVDSIATVEIYSWLDGTTVGSIGITRTQLLDKRRATMYETAQQWRDAACALMAPRRF